MYTIVRTVCMVGLGKLHDRVAVLIHDVIPLDGLHVAHQMVGVELHPSFQDFCEAEPGSMKSHVGTFEKIKSIFY